MTVIDEYPALARRARADDNIALEARRALNEIRTLQAVLEREPITERTMSDAYRRQLVELFRLISEGCAA